MAGGLNTTPDSLDAACDQASPATLFELSHDDDPQVQARVVGKLRGTGSPQALPRLIRLLESPHAVVRNAVRQCLPEYTFSRYVATFDTLDETVQATTGTLVKRVDRNALGRLTSELQAPSRQRQLRAIQMAIAMDAVRDVECDITVLRDSPCQEVRLAAVKAMARCNTKRTETALREMLMDRSSGIRAAAEAALQMFASRRQRVTPLFDPVPSAASGTPQNVF